MVIYISGSIGMLDLISLQAQGVLRKANTSSSCSSTTCTSVMTWTHLWRKRTQGSCEKSLIKLFFKRAYYFRYHWFSHYLILSYFNALVMHILLLQFLSGKWSGGLSFLTQPIEMSMILFNHVDIVFHLVIKCLLESHWNLCQHYGATKSKYLHS